MSTLRNSNQRQDTELKEIGIQLKKLTQALTTLTQKMDGSSSSGQGVEGIREIGGSSYTTDDDNGESNKENNSQRTSRRNQDRPIKRRRDDKKRPVTRSFTLEDG